MDEFTRLGFTQIGVITHSPSDGWDLHYQPSMKEARQVVGTTGAVYAIINPDGRPWKIGQSRNGWERARYRPIIRGSTMRGKERPRFEREVQSGATFWVVRTSAPRLLEAVLTALYRPSQTDASGRHPFDSFELDETNRRLLLTLAEQLVDPRL